MELERNSVRGIGMETFQKGSSTVGGISMESDLGEISPEDAIFTAKIAPETLDSRLERLGLELATLLDTAFTTTARSYWPRRSKELEWKLE